MRLKSFYVSRLGGYFLSGLRDTAWPLLRGNVRNVNLLPPSMLDRPRSTAAPAPAETGRAHAWWEKPGLGLMYQIEARPGWRWQRNFDRFNASVRNPDGTLRFEGPLPRMPEWVAFSARIGCDYHLFEAKWHDGICYWDTRWTGWKTATDYCRQFADESRKAGIPFGYYYSAVFDHNPEFDDIQPLRRATSSFLGMRGGKHAALRRSLGFTQFIRMLFWLMERELKRTGVSVDQPHPFFDDFQLHDFRYDPDHYRRYVLAQLEELCATYGAELVWTDWFGADGEALSDEIMDFMRERHPRVVLTFNASIVHELRWAHFLSWEAHGIASTWRHVNSYRNLARPWELVTPAAANWDLPQPKVNPIENALTAALIMASGGKVNFGIAAQMDGSLSPHVVEQLEFLGAWYRPRRSLFADAVPMRYRKRAVPGVAVSEKRFVTVGACAAGDRLIHVFDLQASPGEARRGFSVELAAPEWQHVERVSAEPHGQQLEIAVHSGATRVSVPAELVDPIDTILRVSGRRG